jgi:hypothetical protein
MCFKISIAGTFSGPSQLSTTSSGESNEGGMPRKRPADDLSSSPTPSPGLATSSPCALLAYSREREKQQEKKRRLLPTPSLTPSSDAGRGGSVSAFDSSSLAPTPGFRTSSPNTSPDLSRSSERGEVDGHCAALALNEPRSSHSVPRSSIPSSSKPIHNKPILMLERAMKTDILRGYVGERGGTCHFHSLFTTLTLSNDAHGTLYLCEYIDNHQYKNVFRRAMRRRVNKAHFCHSCCGPKDIDHDPSSGLRCDDDNLQDIWIGIPFIIYSLPALHSALFDALHVSEGEIMASQDSFAEWLFQPTAHAQTRSMANANLLDVVIAFFKSANTWETIDWKEALKGMCSSE